MKMALLGAAIVALVGGGAVALSATAEAQPRDRLSARDRDDPVSPTIVRGIIDGTEAGQALQPRTGTDRETSRDDPPPPDVIRGIIDDTEAGQALAPRANPERETARLADPDNIRDVLRPTPPGVVSPSE